MNKKLDEFYKTIKPFSIFDHGNNTYALLLDATNVYQSNQNGYDWENMVQSFVASELPEASKLLTYDSEAGMLCVYCNELPCLMNVAEKFKATCDSNFLIKLEKNETEFDERNPALDALEAEIDELIYGPADDFCF